VVDCDPSPPVLPPVEEPDLEEIGEGNLDNQTKKGKNRARKPKVSVVTATGSGGKREKANLDDVRFTGDMPVAGAWAAEMEAEDERDEDTYDFDSRRLLDLDQKHNDMAKKVDLLTNLVQVLIDGQGAIEKKPAEKKKKEKKNEGGNQKITTVEKNENKTECKFGNTCDQFVKKNKNGKERRHCEKFAHNKVVEREKALDQSVPTDLDPDDAMLKIFMTRAHADQSSISTSMAMSVPCSKFVFFGNIGDHVDTICGTAFRSGSYGFSAGHVLDSNPSHLMYFGYEQPTWDGPRGDCKFKAAPTLVIPVSELSVIKYSVADDDDKFIFVWPTSVEWQAIKPLRTGEAKQGDNACVWGYHGNSGVVKLSTGPICEIKDNLVLGAVSTDWGESGAPWMDADGRVYAVHKGVAEMGQRNKGCLLRPEEIALIKGKFPNVIKEAVKGVVPKQYRDLLRPNVPIPSKAGGSA